MKEFTFLIGMFVISMLAMAYTLCWEGFMPDYLAIEHTTQPSIEHPVPQQDAPHRPEPQSMDELVYQLSQEL